MTAGRFAGLVALALGAAAVGCAGGEEETVDAGTATDGGTANTDAGTDTTDAGSTDAGPQYPVLTPQKVALSAQGNDHLHLVVNVVRGDGSQADLYKDWPRWRAWSRQVEDHYSLTRTAPAGEGRQRATTRPELERAAAASIPTDREQLRRIVGEAAAEAGSEMSFVALLRAAGVLVAPHLTGGRVTGYTVALDPALTGFSQVFRDRIFGQGNCYEAPFFNKPESFLFRQGNDAL